MIFLLSNRASTPVSFWPFGTLGSAALGAIVLIAFGLGLLVGMLIQVPHRLRAHRRAKRAEKQLAALQKPAAKTETPEPLSLPPRD